MPNHLNILTHNCGKRISPKAITPEKGAEVMTPDGGPEYQGMTVVFYLYRQLFNASGGSDLGVASAMGWIIAVLISVVTILNFRLQRRWVNYD